MTIHRAPPSPAIIEGLGQAVLIFDAADRLVLDNQAARTILGPDLKLMRAEGWRAAAALFNTRLSDPEQSLDAVRARALTSERPVRFTVFHLGERIPCWAAAVNGESGEVYTVLTLEQPDWTALTELFEKYVAEVRDAVDTTRGHAELIMANVKKEKPSESLEQLSRRISGFARIITVHMHRLGVLTSMMERLEKVRTNALRTEVKRSQRRVELRGFLEDFLEELTADDLADPESELTEFRHRFHLDLEGELELRASASHLAAVLRDLLRNAIMYSMKATPVTIAARPRPSDHTIQIDVIDEGYGIRVSERERVFMPFVRGRQPQVMSEFGYGLSLYLCKHEVEAMNGRIWFESEEGVGTTFSLRLPQWRAESASSASEQA